MFFRNSIMVFLLCSICVLVFTSFPRSVDVEEEKARVKSTIEKYFEMFKTENPQLLSEVLAQAPDIVVFGTTADERFIGWETNKKRFDGMFDGSLDFLTVELYKMTINISESGTVAWFSVLSDWKIKFGEEDVVLDGIRSTGVLEKKEGKWLIMQYHASASSDF